ncbi:Uncharacterised protein [Serratia plymuthica]|nr:Uncharacterised protein [Serratia plymuthica]
MKNKENDGLFQLKILDVVANVFAKDVPYKFDRVLNELNLTREERVERANALNELVHFDDDEDQSDYVIHALYKATLMLEALGYTETAKELFIARNIVKIERENRDAVVRNISKDAIKRQYSKAASRPRNKLHYEIIGIIKATWKKHPAGSKNEMIRRIMAHYPNKVDESTLKRWIKKANLTPPRPLGGYKNFSLVFPHAEGA